MGLKLDQLLIDHSHKFCATIAPANPSGSIDCPLQVLLTGLVSLPLLESLPGYSLVQAPEFLLGSNLKIPGSFHCTMLLHWPQMPSNTSHLSLSFSCTWSLLFPPHPPPVHEGNLVYFLGAFTALMTDVKGSSPLWAVPCLVLPHSWQVVLDGIENQTEKAMKSSQQWTTKL